jgi:predicted small metal-binding protein
MKTITCAQMGGMCDAEMKAGSKDEMMSVAMNHLEEAHPEMAATVKAMPATDPAMVKWSEDFDKTWEATPDTV